MSQRIHDPTETGLPEYSTTGTLRETLEELKDGPDFHITVEIVNSWSKSSVPDVPDVSS
ncbi:MAG: hypothetical protein J6D53_01750 [Blautia sp.]|nr:hypothetical protein [Blautia sp.]